MGDDRKCIDCGRALVDQVRGRPALRCGECKRGRRRIKVRATQVCIDCGAEFLPPGHTGLPPVRCNPCRVERKRATDAAKSARWRVADPERQRAYSRKAHEKRMAAPGWSAYKNEAEMVRKYGITMAEFTVLLESQGGVCAVCAGGRNGPGARFHVDHCHRTQSIRGLLCGKCNTAIGLLNDSPELAERVASYLRR